MPAPVCSQCAHCLIIKREIGHGMQWFCKILKREMDADITACSDFYMHPSIEEDHEKAPGS